MGAFSKFVSHFWGCEAQHQKDGSHESHEDACGSSSGASLSSFIQLLRFFAWPRNYCLYEALLKSIGFSALNSLLLSR